jgi:hypothetical protein
MADAAAAQGHTQTGSADGGEPSAAEPFAPDFDFETIEAAVMETERGRWFLAEYARRLRERETAQIAGSLERIEARLPMPPNPVREAETRLVALGVHQRLIALATALRASGVEEEACERIEAQANALMELVRRRLMDGAADEPAPRAGAGPRNLPAA